MAHQSGKLGHRTIQRHLFMRLLRQKGADRVLHRHLESMSLARLAALVQRRDDAFEQATAYAPLRTS